MSFRNPYPHGGPVSVYPTVDAMRDAYLTERYRSYPSCDQPRVGPLPASIEGKSDWERAALAERRPTAHAIVLLPGRIVLLRFARRASLDDIGRIDLERGLVRQTPELAAVAGWRAEARIVYCDIVAGVEAAARERDITLSMFAPWLLLKWRPLGAAGVARQPFRVRRLGAEVVNAFAEQCERLAARGASRMRHEAERGATVAIESISGE
ncbi:MAG TPA: hypothetical protein VJ718_00760, partial [Candidatus Binataceae bacterium]|nr:hypothetical protein [Candidatus Binataceae bacterium]